MQAWVVAKGRVPLIRENSINTRINYKVWFHPTSILRPVKTLSCLKLIWTGIQGIYMVNPFCSKITQDNQAGIPKSSDFELWEQLPISGIRGSSLFQLNLFGANSDFSTLLSNQVSRPGEGCWVNPGGVTIREILLTWQSGVSLRGIGTHSKRKQKNLFHFWRALHTFCYFQSLAFALECLALTVSSLFSPVEIGHPLCCHGEFLFKCSPVCFQQLGLPDEADICRSIVLEVFKGSWCVCRARGRVSEILFVCSLLFRIYSGF